MMQSETIEKSVVLERSACESLEGLVRPDPFPNTAPTFPNIVSPLTMFGEIADSIGLFASLADRGRVLLHEAQTFEQTGQLRLDAAYDLKVAVDPKTAFGEMARFNAVLNDADGKTVLRMETRLQWMPVAHLSWLQGPSYKRVLRDTSAGSDHGAVWTATRALIDEYLNLAGDRNPAHCDSETALSLGLTDAVVPGMLLVARAEALLRARFVQAPEVLRARFLGFVQIGEEIRFVVSRLGEKDAAKTPRYRVVLVGRDERICAIIDAGFRSSQVILPA